jgi:hypothetical protein
MMVDQGMEKMNNLTPELRLHLLIEQSFRSSPDEDKKSVRSITY